MQTLAFLIATYRATLKPVRTWSKSKEATLCRINADLGTRKIRDISRPMLTTWALKSPRAMSTKGAMLATLSDVLNVGETLFNLQLDARAANQTLKHLKMVQLVPKTGERSRRVSDYELERITETWTGTVPADVTYILRDTCLRSGELCALQWRDVDLQNRTAYLRKRKSRGAMIIPLLGRSAQRLGTWTRSGDRVLQCSQSRLSKTFSRAAERAEIQDIRLHDLRHEGISRLFEQGWSIPQVAAVSGHLTWSNLRRYTHITPQTLLELQHGT